jgi:hypothetical protein
MLLLVRRNIRLDVPLFQNGYVLFSEIAGIS